jgi:hypothetical protein
MDDRFLHRLNILILCVLITLMILIAYNIFYLINHRNLDNQFSAILPNTIYNDQYRYTNLDDTEEEKVRNIINQTINPSFKDIYTNLYEAETQLSPDFMNKYMIDIHKLVIFLKILGLILFTIFLFMISQGFIADLDLLPNLLNDMSISKIIIAFITTGGITMSILIQLMFYKMKKTPVTLEDTINKNYILYKPIELLLNDISDTNFDTFHTNYVVTYFNSGNFQKIFEHDTTIAPDFFKTATDKVISSTTKTELLINLKLLRIALGTKQITDLPSPLNNSGNHYSRIYKKIRVIGKITTIMTMSICVIALFYFYYNQEI